MTHPRVAGAWVGAALLLGGLTWLGLAQPWRDLPQPPLTVRYAALPGVDAQLTSMDVYRPRGRGSGPFPVLVFIHGGGWNGGDKADVAGRARWFTDQGYLLVSVNYRLSPDPIAPDDPERVTHPLHAQDVARAVAYIVRMAHLWSGDPARLGLIGHSAGAHLAALLATHDRLLPEAGVPGAVRAAVALDGAAYDLPALFVRGNGHRALDFYVNAFTDQPALLADASPITHLGPDDPPQLLVHQQDLTRQFHDRYLAAARAAGADVTLYDAQPLDHGQIGAVGDASSPAAAALTGRIQTFLAEHLRP